MPQNTGKKRSAEFEAQAGKGRPKGVKNKTTLAMKEAISCVYNDLQSETGEEHGHFREWAKANSTEFYKLAAKLIPLDVNANVAASVTKIELIAPSEPE